jgi:hypothetical protein
MLGGWNHDFEDGRKEANVNDSPWAIHKNVAMLSGFLSTLGV